MQQTLDVSAGGDINEREPVVMTDANDTDGDAIENNLKSKSEREKIEIPLLEPLIY
jgi:hypothetical protein